MHLKVTCPDCKNQFKSDEVETLNIAEDERGYDVITFRCPKCDSQVDSYVR